MGLSECSSASWHDQNNPCLHHYLISMLCFSLWCLSTWCDYKSLYIYIYYVPTHNDLTTHPSVKSDTDADFVMVHVISNIDAAAMKHGNNSGVSLASSYRFNCCQNPLLFVWKCLIVLALINKSFSIRWLQ